jgi:hypothetical protein
MTNPLKIQYPDDFGDRARVTYEPGEYSEVTFEPGDEGRPITSTPPVGTSWTRFIPLACYVLAAGVVIFIVLTGGSFFAFVIALLIPIGLLFQRRNYSRRMQELGTALLKEAGTVRQRYPDEYPAYFEEAEYELVRLGLGDLVARLPAK